MSLAKLKELAGVILKDSPRFLKALYTNKRMLNGDPSWLRLCNRFEYLEPNPDGRGVRCNWTGSSSLHACSLIPNWRRRLFKRAIDEWPIQFADSPPSGSPVVSFVFAFQGSDRIKQLQKVIHSLFAQDTSIECVVIDLSTKPQRHVFPEQVHYEHISSSHLPEAWYKSWAYNLGAKIATTDVLVFHDGDICVPTTYATEIADALLVKDFQVASLQRHLFYLNEGDTQQVLEGGEIGSVLPDVVLQNWTGGTIAIRKDAFLQIGGFDEGFVDWGGEDGEFYDRCKTLRQLSFGFIPMIHLWHPPQAGRRQIDNPNTSVVLPARLKIDREKRIQELLARGSGQLSGPIPSRSYAETVGG